MNRRTLLKLFAAAVVAPVAWTRAAFSRMPAPPKDQYGWVQLKHKDPNVRFYRYGRL